MQNFIHKTGYIGFIYILHIFLFRGKKNSIILLLFFFASRSIN